MKFKSWVGTVLVGQFLVTVCLAAVQATSAPRFEDYPVHSRLLGQAHSVDLSSHPEANRYRTVLREGAIGPPNFAGKYRVVSWGCGSPCIQIALVDLETGRVYFGPDTTLGLESRVDSSLLVLNPRDGLEAGYGRPLPPVDKRPWFAYSKYYAWSEAEKKFRLVYSEQPSDRD